MAVVTSRQLLDAGVHFGHQTRRWNPKMKRFIFGERNGIYIIDLKQSLGYIETAYNFVKKTVADGGQILFVGTKKQAQESIAEQATRVGMPYVNQRWLGGMLTNFDTIAKRIAKMKELEALDFGNVAASGLTKKELLMESRKKDKLVRTLGGIREMSTLPKAIWVVDTNKEHLAIEEARKLRIPVVGILDTNCDPDEVDYPIPGNDDAIRSVGLLTRVIADAVAEGLIARSQGAVADAADPMPEWERELLGAKEEAPAVKAEAAKTDAPVDSETLKKESVTAVREEAVKAEETNTEAPKVEKKKSGVSAADVKKLRDQTGAGMMDAKKALEEAEGDFTKAIEILRISGQAKVAKRSDRDAANGMVAAVGKTAIQLGCETDFVAKNEEFVSLAKSIAEAAAAAGATDVAAALAVEIDGKPVSEVIADLAGKTGEKLELVNVATFAGETDVYLHRRSKDLPPQIAVMIEYQGEDKEFVRSLCYQVAANAPIYLTREDVPAEVVENELRVARLTAVEEGKPEHLLDRIAEGRLGAFYKEVCLLEQPALEDEKKSVKALCEAAKVQVTRFIRFATGE